LRRTGLGPASRVSELFETLEAGNAASVSGYAGH